MKIQDKVLTLTRLELIEVIQNNPFKSPSNNAIVKALVNTIYSTRYFSEEEYYWIFDNVKSILSHNKEYREKMGLKNARFLDFWVWPDLWPI
jgi:hypothetical protein